jgi:hypothetical protein
VNRSSVADEGEQARLLLRVAARCLEEALDGTTAATPSVFPVGHRKLSHSFPSVYASVLSEREALVTAVARRGSSFLAVAGE